jgi:hypothetical protein
MGEPRFRKLESLLPEDVSILGLDEHTACLMDLDKGEAAIRGIGGVTLRRHGSEMIFQKGKRFPLEVLRGGEAGEEWKPDTPETVHSEPSSEREDASFWNRVHAIEAAFHGSLGKHEPKETTNALLELDRLIWKAQEDLENVEFISQARDVLREMIVSLGVRLESSPRSEADCLAPLVQELLQLREKFRQNKQWHEADAIRESLQRLNIMIEDAKDGPRWRIE